MIATAAQIPDIHAIPESNKLLKADDATDRNSMENGARGTRLMAIRPSRAT
jgi:hypothetical protein